MDPSGQKSMGGKRFLSRFILLSLSFWTDDSKPIQTASWQQYDILKDQKLPC